MAAGPYETAEWAEAEAAELRAALIAVRADVVGARFAIEHGVLATAVRDCAAIVERIDLVLGARS